MYAEFLHPLLLQLFDGMDFYQNMEIVNGQYDIVSKELKTGQRICRNAYMQFVIKDN